MEWKYVLLEYDFIEFCQGSEDRGTTMVLIHCPADCSFNNIRSTLYQKRHRENYHEILIDTVIDVTIEW